MTKYRPENPPVAVDSILQEYLYRQLTLISSALDEVEDIKLRQDNVERSRPREGQIAYADGVNWNPDGLSGEGFYGYYAGSWHFLGVTGAAIPHEVSFYFSGTPGNSEVIYRYVTGRAFLLSSGLPLSVGLFRIAPVGAQSYDILKDGGGGEVSIGSMDFAPASQTATFTFGADEDFQLNDVLIIRAPASADGTATDLSVNLAGKIV